LAFLPISVLKTARSTILLAFSPLLVFENGPEHDTVVIFANSAAQKEPGA
jgi:hypothetical protein